MIYNDSQLFALTRSHYVNHNEDTEDESQDDVTMSQKAEFLRSIGYTTECSPEKINEVQDVQPLRLRANSQVVKDGVTYIVKESIVWNERRYTFKTIGWTISEDLDCLSNNLELNEISAKTLKELKLKTAVISIPLIN